MAGGRTPLYLISTRTPPEAVQNVPHVLPTFTDPINGPHVSNIYGCFDQHVDADTER